MRVNSALRLAIAALPAAAVGEVITVTEYPSACLATYTSGSLTTSITPAASHSGYSAASRYSTSSGSFVSTGSTSFSATSSPPGYSSPQAFTSSTFSPPPVSLPSPIGPPEYPSPSDNPPVYSSPPASASPPPAYSSAVSAAPSATPTPLTDETVNEGVPFAIQVQPVMPLYRKRQANSPSFLDADGYVTNNASAAVQYVINNGELSASSGGQGQVTANPEDLSVPFAVSTNLGSIRTEFFSANLSIAWTNAAFRNGTADFFMVPIGERTRLVAYLNGAQQSDWIQVDFTASPVATPEAPVSSAPVISTTATVTPPTYGTPSQLLETASFSMITSAAPTPSNNVNPEGICGSGTAFNCNGADSGPCCSSYGYCGSGPEYCGAGCQLGYGECDDIVSSSSSVVEPALSDDEPASSTDDSFPNETPSWSAPQPLTSVWTQTSISLSVDGSVTYTSTSAEVISSIIPPVNTLPIWSSGPSNGPGVPVTAAPWDPESSSYTQPIYSSIASSYASSRSSSSSSASSAASSLSSALSSALSSMTSSELEATFSILPISQSSGPAFSYAPSSAASSYSSAMSSVSSEISSIRSSASSALASSSTPSGPQTVIVTPIPASSAASQSEQSAPTSSGTATLPTWITLTSPTPVDYGYIDPQQGSVDDNYAQVVLARPLRFYNVSDVNVFISTNGLLTLSYGTASYYNEAFPNEYPFDSEAVIAPFWDDTSIILNQDPAQGIWYEVTSTTFSVEWYISRASTSAIYHYRLDYDYSSPGIFICTYYSAGPADSDQGAVASVGMEGGPMGARVGAGFSDRTIGSVTPGLVLTFDSNENVIRRGSL